MAGSSPLTPDQQAYYLERFGVRYLTVQEQPLRQSRRVRRASRRLTQADVDVANAQHKTMTNLLARPLQARPL